MMYLRSRALQALENVDCGLDIGCPLDQDRELPSWSLEVL